MLFRWLLASLVLVISTSSGNPVVSSSRSLSCETALAPAVKETTVYSPVNTLTVYLATIYPTTTARVVTVTNYRSTVTSIILSTVNIPFYTTKAPSTTTIPTSKGFTPLVSVKAILPAPLNHTATLIACGTTTTIATSTDRITVSPTKTKSSNGITTTIETTTTTVFSTSTITTSIATVYAGCLGVSNQIRTYRGKTINNFGTLNTENNYPELPQDYYQPAGKYRAANQSPTDCCNNVFEFGKDNATISGWVFHGDPKYYGAFCQPLGAQPSFDLNGWQFQTGDPEYGYVPYPLVMGAGPRDPGVFMYAGECGEEECGFGNQDYVYYGYNWSV